MQWNAKQYDEQHDFVFKYGEGLLADMPKAPGRVLDIGCGTGELSQELTEAGFDVVGIDQSEAMIAVAMAHYPAVEFKVADILDYGGKPAQYDVLFSNACFHWVRAQDRLASVMHRLLKPDGVLVAEFGAEGNIKQIQDAFAKALAKRGITYTSPFYFPNEADYRDLLTRHGFSDVQLKVYARPTVLKGGKVGLRQWLAQFFKTELAEVPAAEQAALFDELDETLAPSLWVDDHWEADYRRIRVHAGA
ncbi:class I SAM-dependent methyltransferase [Lacticaseibacillus baoqingensis]|uniref:Class I SAM-dependent methyltransferase n=1 Tax=Lacticaseibacillus baoqingensis TaxID=2486013 RepID=A0ABW4E840_9LACO|nr:class I SAM-dependent methyltransferase [Lacticaseibacillus baoqingensis]